MMLQPDYIIVRVFDAMHRHDWEFTINPLVVLRAMKALSNFRLAVLDEDLDMWFEAQDGWEWVELKFSKHADGPDGLLPERLRHPDEETTIEGVCDHCGQPEPFNVLCAECEQLVCVDCGRVVCCCQVPALEH